MINFLKQKSPFNFLILLLFGIAIKLPLFRHSKAALATEKDEDLYHHLVNFINSFSYGAFIASVLAFMLLFIQALMLNYIINEYRMITKPNHLPAMAYLLITSLLPEWTYLSSPMLALTLILFCFILLFQLYNTVGAKGQIFNIGLLIGISSYIYFPSICFILCVLLGMLILKPVRFNEIVLFFLGALTPYYFVGAWLFLSDRFTVENFVPNLSISVPEVSSTIYMAISTFLMAIPFLVGGFFIQSHLHKMLIQVRKNWTILLLFLILAFFIPFVNSNSGLDNWILITAQFSAFHGAAYFYPARKAFPWIMLIVTTSFIIYQQYFTSVWQ